MDGEMSATMDAYEKQGPQEVHIQRTSLVALPARAGAPRVRRSMTREQGRALERIGHAADHLFDTYVHQGPKSVVLHGQSPEIQAIRLLVHARERILASLPVHVPLYRRIWNALLGRKTAQLAPRPL
ncbi:MAG: hypothetical protein ACP5EP_07915 [Acidobacteriaceae bacterium]